MKNIFTFGRFSNQLNEGLPATAGKDIKKMTSLELYDYFYNKIKENPDSIIKQLEERIKNPSPIYKKTIPLYNDMKIIQEAANAFNVNNELPLQFILLYILQYLKNYIKDKDFLTFYKNTDAELKKDKLK